MRLNKDKKFPPQADPPLAEKSRRESRDLFEKIESFGNPATSVACQSRGVSRWRVVLDLIKSFFIKGKFLFSPQKHILRKVLVIVLAFAWIFSGWPQIWNNPPFPPEVQETKAAASDDGILVYGDTADDDNLNFRTFTNPTTFGAETLTVDVTTEANDIFHAVIKASPTREEMMAGQLKAGGLFNVVKYNYSGTPVWSEESEIAAVSAAQVCDATAGSCEQSFDLAYEQTSGDAIVVYGKAANDGIIYYNVYNGTSWAGEQSYTFRAGSAVDTRWVRLVADGEQRPSRVSDKMILLVGDAGSYITAAIWDGSAFGSLTTITATASVPNRRPFDGAWESVSGAAVVVYGEGTVNSTTPFKYKKFDGASWDSTGTSLPALTSSIGAWVEMASDPQSNRVAAALEHFSTAAVTTGMFAPVIWKADGSTEGWTLGNTDTTLENPIAKGVAAAWENYNSGTSFAMFLSADDGTADVSDYETWTAGAGNGTFSAINDIPGTQGDDANAFKLYANPFSDKMMLLGVDIDSDLNRQIWDGSDWLAAWGGELSTVTPPGTTANKETNSWAFAYKVYNPPGVSGSLGKSSDGWSGAIPVYMTLSGISNADYPYARAKVDTPAPVTWYTTMTWSAANDRFEGTIYIGSNYCNGCADPNTGTFTVTVQLDNDPNFGSIDYSASSGTFSTYITRRWNAISIAAMGNSTEFNPTWNAGGWWDYQIRDLSIGGTAAAQTNVAFAIPFHPTTATITNMAVTIAAVSVPQGTAASTTDCWYWDSPTHTLYIQKASVALGTYYTITLDFDSDTDLFASRIDRVQTLNMGERLFYNGLMWGNNYIGTGMFGGGHEGAGEQMELQARDFATNNDVSIDCMERVAVHVDNTIAADASAYYSADIKWKQQEWAGYIISEDNNSIVTRTNSDGAASGWQQQLNNGIAAYREQTFYANERYIKNVYQLTNNGASTRIYPLVWGREQWIGLDRATLDQGRFDGDTADRTIESTVAISSLTDPWMTSYDTGIFAAMGVIFQDSDRARYGYFLSTAAILNALPWAEWVNQGTEYRVDDNDVGTTASDTFFDKNYPSVAVGASTTFTFWQWGYDTTSWANIESAISADEAEINNTAPTLSVSQPDGFSDTVTVGDLYNITYTLSDPDNVVTAAFYYDVNNTGLDGTAITGACATAAEGTDVTCSWNTTGVTPGSYYVYGITNDGVNPQVSAYSPGQITINAAGALTVDIVDGAGSPVGSPSMAMGATTLSFTYQTVNGTFGASAQKIRVDNTTGNAQWSLTLAATGGATAFWDGTPADYDFNDPTVNAGDGGDADNLGGQMTINPSGATITPKSGCTNTGLTLGSSASYSQGVTDTITLLSAGSSAGTNCYWDTTGITVSQTIPKEQPVASDYNINMTLTVTAI